MLRRDALAHAFQKDCAMGCLAPFGRLQLLGYQHCEAKGEKSQACLVLMAN